MPSRSNRIRQRRALTGDASEASDDATTSPLASKSDSRSKPRRSLHPRKDPQDTDPGRLKRLLALLLVTTILLSLYHAVRLYTKGQGILGASTSSPLRDLFSKGKASSRTSPHSTSGSLGGGGMMIHPSSPSDRDNSDIKLEDLDMDTLQAAFDALYGDGGPLGPGSKRGDGSGEYRVTQQGRKESLT